MQRIDPAARIKQTDCANRQAVVDAFYDAKDGDGQVRLAGATLDQLEKL
ncbi:MAG: hypothetical protein AAFU77_09020 [Myxococcota bacterium]